MDDILKTVDLPDGRVVLFRDATNVYRAENLVRLNSDGSLRWRAALPANTGPDNFTDAALDGPRIRANTWSGWVIWFDHATGTVSESKFGK
jgi:hypothetical protein